VDSAFASAAFEASEKLTAAADRWLRNGANGPLADDAAVAIAQTTLRVRRRDQSFASLPEGFFKYEAAYQYF